LYSSYLPSGPHRWLPQPHPSLSCQRSRCSSLTISKPQGWVRRFQEPCTQRITHSVLCALCGQYEASLSAFLKDASIADFADLPRPSVDLRDLVEEYNVDKLRSAMLLLKVTEGPQDEEEILKREVNEESIPKKVGRTTRSELNATVVFIKD
jgi:hypothetical protein